MLGRRDDYPDSARLMDEYWIELLRRFNDGLPESGRIRFRYIDMNHPHDAFMLSVSWMVRGTEVGERIGPIVAGVLATRPGTDEYYEAVGDLARRLGEEHASITEAIGETWYHRLAEAVEIEIRSIPIRRRRDVHARESIMIDLAMRTIDRATGAVPSTVAINVGMFHAQKRRYMGTRQEWLGEYLAANADRFDGTDRLYSIAFWGFSGERIRTFMDQDPQPIPAAVERPASNLSRRIAEAVARRDGSDRPYSAAFLELSHPVFSRRMSVAFTFSPVRAAPARQFDAYVIFPEITVLDSLRRSW
ncbi:MAG: hypothetical protein EA426_00025 [Spirochaetaceae bacterium]|nr:MAG: hypothetical protein EA426_00025 [Spirochaetaceae bacterium]